MMRTLLSDVARTLVAVVRRPQELPMRLHRAVGMLRAEVVFRGAEVGDRVSVMGPLEVHNRGKLVLKARFYFLEGMLASRLVVSEGAQLTVGEASGFNYGVHLEAHRSITIGSRTIMASGVKVCDRDANSLAPIVIGDDCWLAHGVHVGPGVTLGDGCVISAGTVVTRDVPAHHLAIGSPVRNLRLDTLSRAR